MNSSDQCYIKLFHGRRTPDERLGDWGAEGPVIGPVGLTWTYGRLKIHAPGWTGFEFLPERDGLIAYGGMFYGDCEIIHAGDPLLRQLRRERREFHDYRKFAARLGEAGRPARAATSRRRATQPAPGRNLGTAWAAIPHYGLGRVPDSLPDKSPVLYRRIIAKRAILAGYEDDGQPGPCIADLLSDLRHLCDGLGLDFAGLDRGAYRHYAHEKSGQRL